MLDMCFLGIIANSKKLTMGYDTRLFTTGDTNFPF